MKVTVEYAAQVKRSAGTASETIDVAPSCTVQQLVDRLAATRGESFRQILFGSDGTLHPSILLFVGDAQVRWTDSLPLKENDVVTILSPISGG